MSYVVLARKYRPKNFMQMVGQEHVVRALTNALDSQRLHHAYLFTGTRGVGKTTIARILARCLNCETGITSTPCGECSACREINEGRFIDLIEVDAASRTPAVAPAAIAAAVSATVAASTVSAALAAPTLPRLPMLEQLCRIARVRRGRHLRRRRLRQLIRRLRAGHRLR